MGTHYKGKLGEVRSLDAYIKLIRATGSVRAGLERKLALHKLTENQLSVLEVLLHLGPMCQTALATKIRATTASVTLLVDQLEDRKLVHRERSAEAGIDHHLCKPVDVDALMRLIGGGT